MSGVLRSWFVSFFCLVGAVQSVVYADDIQTYFESFERLAKTENWKEIIIQGKKALEEAGSLGQVQAEAKICAQLTSTAFYQGDYDLALEYAGRCHELSEAFEDPALFLRALYLESAVYRAFAGKKNSDEFYSKAVKTAERAVKIYVERNVKNRVLEGKIYFNLGAAHADNLQGDWNEAKKCYSLALECFKDAGIDDDYVRTSIRLGKVYLLQGLYEMSQKIVDEVRPLVSSSRLAMHVDYLEAQLKLALGDQEGAFEIARRGFSQAEILGAKEDRARFGVLLKARETSD